MRRISATVNGVPREVDVEPRQLLVYFLRDRDLAVVRPSVYFTGLSAGASQSLPVPDNIEYRIQSHPGARVVAKDGGFFLNRVAR